MHTRNGNDLVSKHFQFFHEIITNEEEDFLCDFLKEKFKKKKYQSNHWDNVISRYREIEFLENTEAEGIFNRLKAKIKEHHDVKKFLPPHAIDLAANGHIGITVFLFEV